MHISFFLIVSSDEDFILLSHHVPKEINFTHSIKTLPSPFNNRSLFVRSKRPYSNLFCWFSLHNSIIINIVIQFTDIVNNSLACTPCASRSIFFFINHSLKYNFTSSNVSEEKVADHLLEGDILLDPMDPVDYKIMKMVKEDKMEEAEDRLHKRQATRSLKHLWHNRVIPYQIDLSLSKSLRCIYFKIVFEYVFFNL